MKLSRLSLAFAAGTIAGCMASGSPTPAQAPPPPGTKPPQAEAPSPAAWSRPLLIDRTDLRIGTTVEFGRIPTVGELHDVTLLPGLAHVVISLPEWPKDFASLEPLSQLPQGSDLIVVLPGYPPSTAAAEAWNYINASLRIILVVPGPPPSVTVVTDLNAMRRLERVIAEMNDPSRSGFERLQRPLSFLKRID